MATVIMVIVLVIMFAAVAYSFLVTVGFDNFKGINLELDKMYNNTSEVAYAVIDKLKKQGKECNILELGKGYPKLLVDGKEYTMCYRMASIAGFPTQVVQLRLCKK